MSAGSWIALATAAFGAVAAMVWVTRRTGKPDPSMLANGMLAGLVATTLLTLLR